LFVIALLGPGPVSVFIALSIAAIPAYVNVSRASALTARSSESVLTARVMGLSSSRIFARYVAVEAIQPAIALFSLGVSFTILTAASLSFLGLGVQAPTPDWGLMLAEARDYLARAWWLITFPGIALTATVASFAVLGRAVQRSMR
jgi:ABC-type dipeptide/oligopeptide/nickel transport system permease subunit